MKSDFALSCLSAWNNLGFSYFNIFQKYVKTIQVSLKSDKNNGSFTWRLMYLCGNISVLLRIRNVSNKPFRENQNTHFMFNNFFSENCAVYEINVEKYCTPRQATGENMIQHMCIACWITKPKDTHPECVIIIVFAQQLWLHKCPSIYVYTYTACLVFSVLPLGTSVEHTSFLSGILEGLWQQQLLLGTVNSTLILCSWMTQAGLYPQRMWQGFYTIY